MSHAERLQATACPTNYKFTSYERDSETGLDYAFARYYSSRLGRFLSTDPIGGSVGSLQSHNAYSYVVNNPMNSVDPSGLVCSAATPHGDSNCNPGNYGGGGGSGLFGGYGFFDLLTFAFTETGIERNPLYWDNFNACWLGDCPGVSAFLPVYGNMGALSLLLLGPGGGGNPIDELKGKVRELFKNQAKCAALFGDQEKALKQVDIASIYPPGSFNPSVPGSVPANYTLLSYPHGAAFSAGNIFLGPKFFDQSIGAQETILIHELRHQAYNTGEPPITSPAYQAHRTKEDHGIVAACGTQIPTKN